MKINNYYRWILFVILFSSQLAFALVSGPESSVIKGEYFVELKNVTEKGRTKPYEDPASWQNANINTNQISLGYGLGDFEGLGYEHFLKVDLKSITSGEEKNGVNFFYSADAGNQFVLSYGLKFIRETDYTAGVYLSYSTHSLSSSKFSNPRLDTIAAGLNSNMNVGNGFFIENLLHYGSGLAKDQNPYFLLSSYVGYRTGKVGQFEPALRAGPYVEIDMEERLDANYDAVYGTGATTDKIRQIKLANALFLDLNFSRKYVFSVGSVQKLVGQDVRSTEALTFSLAAKF